MFKILLPPVWFLLAIVLMLGLHLWLPIQQLFFSPFIYLGIALGFLGISILLFCAYIFHQKNTTIKPFEKSSSLVTEGIFQYSRNPIYLAMIIALNGWWIFLGSLTPVSIIPIFAWLIQEKFIKQEEQMLENEFGKEYQEYKAIVRRWI
ncbi:MAG: isoprenylcysteine carboxylmethyltransferase family protein [Pleurocapsa sp.]